MPKSKVCEALIRKSYLKSISIDRIKENLKTLLGNVDPISTL